MANIIHIILGKIKISNDSSLQKIKNYIHHLNLKSAIWETKRNVSVGFDEHNKLSKKSKLSTHLEKRMKLEAFFVAVISSSLKVQLS